MCASGELYIETTIQPREEIHTEWMHIPGEVPRLK